MLIPTCSTKQEMERKARQLAIEQNPLYKGKHIKVYSEKTRTESLENCFDVIVYSRTGKLLLYCQGSLKG